MDGVVESGFFFISLMLKTSFSNSATGEKSDF
jgi:hypothetical protein